MDAGGNNGSRPRSNNNSRKNAQVTDGGLRKGPWTVEEDAILKDYVTKNGIQNWKVVRNVCGLKRCSKSCRLRWVNHLRPNLKKGAFSVEEEVMVLHLHSIFGNKWSSMTSQLPGRTDNEIKNFWNTRLKRRKKANLPIYPTPSEEEEMKIRMELHAREHLNNNMVPCVPNYYSNQNYTVFNYQNNNNEAFAFSEQHKVGFVGTYNDNSSVMGFSTKSYINLGSNMNPASFGSQTYAQNNHQAMYNQVEYTPQRQGDMFNQQLDGDDGLLEDIVNQVMSPVSENSKNQKMEPNQLSQDQQHLYDYKINNEELPSIGVQEDFSLYGEPNLIPEIHFHQSNSSLLPAVGLEVGAPSSSMETNAVDYDFLDKSGNFPVTHEAMPDWYNSAGPVANNVQFSTSLHGVQPTILENHQEVFNSMMAMETPQSFTDNSDNWKIMPGGHLNSMAMEIPQPFMDNSYDWNIMPGNQSSSMEMALSQPFMDESGNWNIMLGDHSNSIETSQPFMDTSGNWNIMLGFHEAFNGNGNVSGIQWQNSN